MLFLTVGNMATTSEKAIEWAQKVLYHIRNLVIFQLGIQMFEEDLARNVYDRLKKELKVLGPMISLMFSGTANESVLPPLSLTFSYINTATSLSPIEESTQCKKLMK